MPNALLPAAEPNLDSFVLRFVRSGEPAQPAGAPKNSPGGPESTAPGSWHGVIRHVQSNRERAFSRWADAVAFISEFVSVQETTIQQADDD
jgi:hypothetical protein